MAHQFVREPLRAEEADRLANACRSPEEKLIVWTLLDTGLRVSELCALTLDNVQWQQRALRVAGKGGPHGTRSKQRVYQAIGTVPSFEPSAVDALLEQEGLAGLKPVGRHEPGYPATA